jgi:hypothetical protein
VIAKHPFAISASKWGILLLTVQVQLWLIRVRGGPAASEIRQDYNDPEAQHLEESVSLPTTVNNEVNKPESNIVIDHFDGQVLTAAQSI